VNFGESLKRERERQGATLEAIAEATKVPVRQLEALERDDQSELPGGVFHRGIVQSYCRTLGLDESEWRARYAATEKPDDQDWTEFAEAVKRGRTPETALGHGALC
jgi:cytoskeleton protein RodZ